MVDAARREVREEAGVDGELEGKLGDVRYWYQRDDRRIFKVVSFYLFRYTGGRRRRSRPRDRGGALDRRCATRPAQLTFKGEREMVERALSKLADDR